MSTPTEIMNAYLEAFTSGPDGADKARQYIADDFEFVGPMQQTTGADAFFEGASGLGAIVQGIRMGQQVEHGNEVMSSYEFLVGLPGQEPTPVQMAEWTTIEDGKLVRSRLLFDVEAFQAAMPEMAGQSG